MTQIIAGTKTEFAIDPDILALLPTQGCIELQHDAAGKVHAFHTHPVDEVLVVIKGRLTFRWEGGERICTAGDKILLPAGTLHESEALDDAIYAIAMGEPATIACNQGR
ncbi:cupin domain-containing protein [Bradyrhizobium sp. USDA 4353]